MTHSEIMETLGKKPTIVDYISMAVADGWPKGKVVAELTGLYIRAAGDDFLDEISELYDQYMDSYGVSCDVITRRKHEPQKSSTRKRKHVLMNGIEYDSITEAAKQNFTYTKKIRQYLESGEAQYV